MSKIRELVLGGEGLIGWALAKRLRERRHEVVALDPGSGHDLRYIDKAKIAECDRVWFLAWDTGGARYIESVDRQQEMYKHNCELSVRMFDALAQTQKPFLFTTSQLAGQAHAYGTTKLMGWHWAAHLGGKVARLRNVYGWEEPSVRSHVINEGQEHLASLHGLVLTRGLA